MCTITLSWHCCVYISFVLMLIPEYLYQYQGLYCCVTDCCYYFTTLPSLHVSIFLHMFLLRLCTLQVNAAVYVCSIDSVWICKQRAADYLPCPVVTFTQ